jgi:hypothetical protein
MPMEQLEVVRQESLLAIKYMAEPMFIENAKHHLAHDLADHMLKHGYIAFDDKMSDPQYARMRATIGVVPKDKVLPVAKELEQLQAQLTCMCGDYVNHHSMGSGHSPVSMYDYSLDKADEENNRLKAKVEQLENRLEEVFP